VGAVRRNQVFAFQIIEPVRRFHLQGDVVVLGLHVNHFVLPAQVDPGQFRARSTRNSSK